MRQLTHFLIRYLNRSDFILGCGVSAEEERARAICVVQLKSDSIDFYCCREHLDQVKLNLVEHERRSPNLNVPHTAHHTPFEYARHPRVVVLQKRGKVKLATLQVCGKRNTVLAQNALEIPQRREMQVAVSAQVQVVDAQVLQFCETTKVF